MRAIQNSQHFFDCVGKYNQTYVKAFRRNTKSELKSYMDYIHFELYLTEPDIQFTRTSHSIERDVLYPWTQILLFYTDRIIHLKLKKEN